MEETVIVIMQKNKQTGFLEKELASFNAPDYENLIVNVFAQEDSDDKLKIHMKVSTDKDVENWQFNAIYDYYDEQIWEGKNVECNEEADCYNPTWELVFSCPDDLNELEDFILDLLSAHSKELNDVFETIKDKEEAYSE